MGEGTIAFDDAQGQIGTGLSMQMAAFGSRHAFRHTALWGLLPELSADGFWVRLQTEERLGLRAMAGEASRLRLGAMVERPIEGDGWTPRFGFGLRHENDERGTFKGMEVRTGFGYVDHRLSVDAMTHRWASESGEWRDSEVVESAKRSWGARVTVRYASPDGLGFGAELDALTGRVPDAPLWESEAVSADAAGSRLSLRAGYGLVWGGAHWTPYGEVRFGEAERTLREGLRYHFNDLALHLYGEHREQDSGETDHGLHLSLSVRF